MSTNSIISTAELPSAAFQSLLSDAEDKNTQDEPILGGIFSQTNYIWLVNGANLLVFNAKTLRKIASWSFGTVLRDTTVKIVCVTEIRRSNQQVPILAIGLDSSLTSGSVCIFDIHGSIVLRVIQIKNKVTSLHVVETSADFMLLPGPLRAFDGILAVGTAGGEVLLVDLCQQQLDDVIVGVTEIKDEVDPSKISVITCDSLNQMEERKEISVLRQEHLTLHLNALLVDVSEHFVLKAPNGSNKLYVNKDEVKVSCMHYCTQLGSLLVGFNFGAFQLWDLVELKLVYTSPVYEDNIPVTHFTYQEPSDDPRAFCYIWAVYSNSEPFQTGFPLAVLYSLTYKSKELHEDYGYLYQDFVGCGIRFQMDLTMIEDTLTPLKVQGGHCLNMNTISKSLTSKTGNSVESAEKLSLCCILWSVWCNDQVTYTYQCVFDLNQWYKEQMPDVVNWNNCEGYISYKCLTDILNTTNEKSSPILDAQIKTSTLSQYMGVQRLEEHYYPSSLSYDCCVLSETNVHFVNVKGIQRSCLHFLESSGPLLLIKPTEIYNMAVNVGLIPIFMDVSLHTTPNLLEQRRLLMSVALEEQMVGWLCKCAKEWSNGSYSGAQCTLEMLLNWAWDRTTVLKKHADSFCVPLFDYSGTKLDDNAQSCLNSCTVQLKNLHTLYTFVLDKYSNFLAEKDIFAKRKVSLEMVSVYFDVVQWLLNVKLLPECASVEEDDDGSVPYPAETLINYYNQRRAELRAVNNASWNNKDNLLYIDALIEANCGGVALQKVWEDDGGTGLYPPTSLQALLHTYLVENVDMTYKHALVVYVFLDLTKILNANKYNFTIMQLIKFPSVFKLSPSVIKITQAFWHLDHGYHSTAMEHLLDPLVSTTDLQHWQHQLVLRALFAQEQFKFAALYMQIRQPPVTDKSDLFLTICILVANNMLDEAFYFERLYRHKLENYELMMYLFSECERQRKLHKVITRNLTPLEEETLSEYLKEAKHPRIKDLRICFNIQRGRYTELDAESGKEPSSYTSLGLKGQANIGFCEFMLQCYPKEQPIYAKRPFTAEMWNNFDNPKPKPMSVLVHEAKEKVKYKSTQIAEGISKDRDDWSHNKSTRTPILFPVKRRIAAPVIHAKLTETKTTNSEETGVSPPKRRKTSTPINTTFNVTAESAVKLSTPLIKRVATPPRRKFSVETPHSILKINRRMSFGRGESTTPEEIAKEEKKEVTKKRKKEFSFGLSPRKSLEGSLRQGVRFEDFRPVFRSSVEKDATKEEEPKEVIETACSSATTQETSSEKFYSPEASLLEKEEDNEPQFETKSTEEPIKTIVPTPTKRRSLRASSCSPVRSSPRLQSSASVFKANEVTSPVVVDKSVAELSPLSSSKRVKSRPSLAQMVLTNNAFAKISSEENISFNSVTRKQSISFKNQEDDLSEDMDCSRVTAFTLSSFDEDDSSEENKSAAFSTNLEYEQNNQENAAELTQETREDEEEKQEMEPIVEEPCVKKTLDFVCPESDFTGNLDDSSRAGQFSSFLTSDDSTEAPPMAEVGVAENEDEEEEEEVESPEYEVGNNDPAMPSFVCEEVVGLKEVEAESAALYEEMAEVQYYTEVNEGFDEFVGMKDITANKTEADKAFLKDTSSSSGSDDSSSSSTDVSTMSDRDNATADKAFLKDSSSDRNTEPSSKASEPIEISDSNEESISSGTSNSSDSESDKKNESGENASDYGELNKAVIIEEKEKLDDEEDTVDNGELNEAVIGEVEKSSVGDITSGEKQEISMDMETSNSSFVLTRSAARRLQMSPSPSLVTGVKRLRSKSVDDGTEEPVRTLRKRSASIANDSTYTESKMQETPPKSMPKKGRNARTPVAKLPVIQEEGKKAVEAEKSFTVDDFLQSRRLTRSQRSLLEKNISSLQGIDEVPEDTVTSGESTLEERGPVIDRIDPIRLLNKSPFKGSAAKSFKNLRSSKRVVNEEPKTVCAPKIRKCNPDPEEQHFNVSPTSSISGTSNMSARKLPEEVSAKRTRKRKSPKTTVKGTKGRLRSMSFDETAKPKETRTRRRLVSQSDEATSTEPIHNTRSKAKSVSSVQSETTGKRTRARTASSSSQNRTNPEASTSKGVRTRRNSSSKV